MSIIIQMVANWVHERIFIVRCCDSRALHVLAVRTFVFVYTLNEAVLAVYNVQ